MFILKVGPPCLSSTIRKVLRGPDKWTNALLQPCFAMELRDDIPNDRLSPSQRLSVRAINSHRNTIDSTIDIDLIVTAPNQESPPPRC